MADNKLPALFHMNEAKLSGIYYSPKGYWKGLAAIKNLSAAAKVSEDMARAWLKKQAIWQIYLPAPKEVADALSRIYRRGPLTWPKLLQVDPGREFMGTVSQLLAKQNVEVRRGRVDVHRDQGIVERFNRTLAERLFGHQYAQEMLLAARGSSERSAEWVARLPAVVAALNDEATRLTGKKPSEAIKAGSVAQKPSSTVPGRSVGLREKKIPSDVLVRYLYAPGELEGGRRRATDPIWSLTIHTVRNVTRQAGQPALYYINDGPQSGFVREELLIVPPDTSCHRMVFYSRNDVARSDTSTLCYHG